MMKEKMMKRNRWKKALCFAAVLLLAAVVVAMQSDACPAPHTLQSDALQKGHRDTVRFVGDTMIVCTELLGKKIQGYAGTVPLDVYLLHGKVVKVVALPNNETPGFFQSAAAILGSWNGLTPKQALAKKVDAVSGATFSSRAIIDNVKAALEYASAVDEKALRAKAGNGTAQATPQSAGFHPIDVMKPGALQAGFPFFTDDDGHGLLLCSGDAQAHNAMTIGWGGLGTLWSRPTVTVYVAQARYTHQFMDKYAYFTVMHFPDNRVVDYMGAHSGRDGDKAQALGLHTLYTENGTPYYAEADLVIECRTMYGQDFDPAQFRTDAPRNFYARSTSGVHTMYMGEVVSAWQK